MDLGSLKGNIGAQNYFLGDVAIELDKVAVMTGG